MDTKTFLRGAFQTTLHKTFCFLLNHFTPPAHQNIPKRSSWLLWCEAKHRGRRICKRATRWWRRDSWWWRGQHAATTCHWGDRRHLVAHDASFAECTLSLHRHLHLLHLTSVLIHGNFDGSLQPRHLGHG